MVLIFGGAYQGKLDFAKEKFGLKDEDIFDCKGNYKIDFSKRAIDHFEDFVRLASSECVELEKYIEFYKDRFSDKIIIVRDESRGVVPIDTEDRAYRELAGRAFTKLAHMSDEVYRVFLGMGEKIK